jgi:hypothetical protein
LLDFGERTSGAATFRDVARVARVARVAVAVAVTGGSGGGFIVRPAVIFVRFFGIFSCSAWFSLSDVISLLRNVSESRQKKTTMRIMSQDLDLFTPLVGTVGGGGITAFCRGRPTGRGAVCSDGATVVFFGSLIPEWLSTRSSIFCSLQVFGMRLTRRSRRDRRVSI